MLQGSVVVSRLNGYPMTKRPLKDETLLGHAGNKPQANFGVVNPPVYHASTILYPTVAPQGGGARNQ
jgi:cystathionine beta-lyase/cystathionine gamma-synthase